MVAAMVPTLGEFHMPQFILDYGTPGSARQFGELDSFTQAYIEALFFTEAEHGTDSDTWNPEDQRSLLGDVTFADLAPGALADIVEDCRAFQEGHADDLALAYENVGYDEERAGHDFWLTRNGHGAGFQDRGLGAVGDRLSKMAKAYGSVDVYLGDDGLIYA
jgi:hypothetical protein